MRNPDCAACESLRAAVGERDELIRQLRAEIAEKDAQLIGGSMNAGERTWSNVHDWNEHEVIEWLHHIGMGNYAAVFEGKGVNGADLLKLGDDDRLKSLGIPYNIHRRKIIREVAALSGMGSAAPTPTGASVRKSHHRKHGRERTSSEGNLVESGGGIAGKQLYRDSLEGLSFCLGDARKSEGEGERPASGPNFRSQLQKPQALDLEMVEQEADTEGLLSETGSMQVEGFQISESGIKSSPLHDTSPLAQSKLPLQVPVETSKSLLYLEKLTPADGTESGTEVFKALYMPGLTLVAVKVKPAFELEERQRVAQEMSAMRHNFNFAKLMNGLSFEACLMADGAAETSDAGGAEQQGACTHLVSLYDCFSDPRPESRSLSIVLEFMDAGSLQDLIDARCALSTQPHILAKIAFSVSKGLQHLHSKRILHRSLQPSNILISKAGIVKISDFGLAKDLSSMAATDDGAAPGIGAGAMAQTRVGGSAGILYFSPERVNGNPYSYPSDIWSAGMVILACAMGRFPFEEALEEEQEESGSSDIYFTLVELVSEGVSPALVAELLDVDIEEPGVRPTPMQTLVDLVASCLRRDPKTRAFATAATTATTRLGASSRGSLLGHPFIRDNYTPPEPLPVDDGDYDEDDEDDEDEDVTEEQVEQLHLIAAKVIQWHCVRESRQWQQQKQQQLDAARVVGGSPTHTSREADAEEASAAARSVLQLFRMERMESGSRTSSKQQALGRLRRQLRLLVSRFASHFGVPARAARRAFRAEAERLQEQLQEEVIAADSPTIELQGTGGGFCMDDSPTVASLGLPKPSPRNLEDAAAEVRAIEAAIASATPTAASAGGPGGSNTSSSNTRARTINFANDEEYDSDEDEMDGFGAGNANGFSVNGFGASTGAGAAGASLSAGNGGADPRGESRGARRSGAGSAAGDKASGMIGGKASGMIGTYMMELGMGTMGGTGTCMGMGMGMGTFSGADSTMCLVSPTNLLPTFLLCQFDSTSSSAPCQRQMLEGANRPRWQRMTWMTTCLLQAAQSSAQVRS
jgi:serine/threonine protein kinase